MINHVQGKHIIEVVVRHRGLRYPIDMSFESHCQHQKILTLSRRSKYLKFELEKGYILLHLGMSGHLRVLPTATKPQKHDHVDIILDNDLLIRYHDPRRFGMINWFNLPEKVHPLLNKLAPEPLTSAFNTNYFYQQCQQKKKVIKKILMDSHIVVGVGNIYAQECLFLEGISPNRPSNSLSFEESKKLVRRIKRVLKKAISQGGTTLKDFKNVEGKPGYFSQVLHVYGREEQPCTQCKVPLHKCLIDNRSTVYCINCQK